MGKKSSLLLFVCCFLTQLVSGMLDPFHVLPDYYKILGLDAAKASRYSETDIKQAYMALAKVLHPDKNARAGLEERKEKEEQLKLVIDAYDALKDEESRELYHQHLGIQKKMNSDKTNLRRFHRYFTLADFYKAAKTDFQCSNKENGEHFNIARTPDLVAPGLRSYLFGGDTLVTTILLQGALAPNPMPELKQFMMVPGSLTDVYMQPSEIKEGRNGVLRVTFPARLGADGKDVQLELLESVTCPESLTFKSRQVCYKIREKGIYTFDMEKMDWIYGDLYVLV